MVSRRNRAIIAAFALAIFVALSTAVILHFDPLIRLDIATVALLSTLRPPLLEQLALAVTALGGTTFITIVSITVGILLFVRRHPLWKTLVVSLVGTLVTFELVKFVVERARPDLLYAAYQETYFSFPSGHASLSAALYGFLGLLAAHHAPKRERTRILLIGCGLALLIGCSRVYLGVHYPSDVFAGFALGIFWLAIGTRFAER